jgi:membrane-bound lytic murein transglycosylase D
LNTKTPFNIEYNPSLESVIKSFLKNRRQHFEKMIGLSHLYFPMFERELDNNDVPLEVKYLAIVESALKPRAKSRVGATGLWQFMFATGKYYDLNVSSYVDERSDPIKSTQAAAKYLASLYKIFGDWDLALAAYNSGPGNVSKAIRRSGGYQNYWNIRHNLPRETAGYLPAFLATMYIFEYAEEHGFISEKPMFQHIETDTIQVKQMITLDQVSEATKVNIEELQFLNPSYKLDIIPFIKGENYALRLPRQAVGIFVNNEEAIYAAAQNEFNKREKPLPQFFDSKSKVRYRVRSGDYLGKIARKYGVRVSQIKQWNGLRSNNLRIGQRLTIYPRNTIATNSSIKAKPTSISTSKTYIVKSGDSLWSISQKFPGVSIQNIRDWNDISGNNLKPGMKLKIPKS